MSQVNIGSIPNGVVVWQGALISFQSHCFHQREGYIEENLALWDMKYSQQNLLCLEAKDTIKWICWVESHFFPHVDIAARIFSIGTLVYWTWRKSWTRKCASTCTLPVIVFKSLCTRVFIRTQNCSICLSLQHMILVNVKIYVSCYKGIFISR